MKNLYEQHKSAWDKLASEGYPNLADAAKFFKKPSEMDFAIGFNNAVHHWISGRNASRTSDERARRWLDLQRKSRPTIQPHDPQIMEPQGVLLLVACPHGSEDKARKLLTFIGCEVTEV